MNKTDFPSSTITNEFPGEFSEQIPECSSVEAIYESTLNALDGWCQICGKNLQHLNSQRQAQHINRCMDHQQGEQSEASSSSSVNNLLPKLKVLDCPICGQAFKTDNSRRVHLKKCANKFSVSIPQLLELIKMQEEEHNAAAILVQTTGKASVKNVVRRKRVRKEILDEPRSKFDEDTHLAIALSVSDTSIAEFQPGTCDSDSTHLTSASCQKDVFSFMMSSKSLDKSELMKQKKRKKKIKCKEPLPLLALDQADLQRKLEVRVSDLILASSDTPLYYEAGASLFPASRVQSKYFVKSNSSNQSKGKALWHGSCFIKSSDSYYVEELSPYVKFTPPSRLESSVKLPESSHPALRHTSREASTAQIDHALGRKADSRADTTLYGSTQTAAVLAELAAEHGDQTFNADETFAESDGVDADRVKHKEISFVGVESLVADGFCLQSTEEEVSKTAVRDLLRSFESLVNSRTYSDLIVKAAGEQTVYAHRSILGVRCPRILQMVDAAGVVHLEDFTKDAILALFRHLYLADVKIPLSVVVEVQRIANRLQLSSLFCICDDLIKLKGVNQDRECSLVAVNDNVTETTSSIGQVRNEDTLITDELDGDSEIAEVYTYFATQRRRQSENNDNDEIETETEIESDNCDDNNTDAEAAYEADKRGDTVNGDQFDSIPSMDSNICLSQALLQKLDESFTLSCFPKYSVTASTSDVDADVSSKVLIPIPSPSSVRSASDSLKEEHARVDSDADVRSASDSLKEEHARVDSDADCCNAMDEFDDPCAGYYDRVNVDEEKSSFSKPETGEERCGGTYQSTYSAASPLSLFDDDPLVDTNGLKCLESSSSCVLVETVNKITPRKTEDDLDELRVLCTSPDDLFGSPSSVISQKTDSVVEKLNTSSCEPKLSRKYRFDDDSVESLDCCEDVGQNYFSTQGSAHTSDDVIIENATVSADPLCGKSQPTYAGKRQVRAKSRNNVRDNDLSEDKQLDKNDRSSISKLGSYQQRDLEPEREDEDRLSIIKSPSSLKKELNAHPQIDVSVVNAEVIIVDDENSNSQPEKTNVYCSPDNISGQNTPEKTGVHFPPENRSPCSSPGNASVRSTFENTSIQCCRNETTQLRCVGQVSITEIDEAQFDNHMDNQLQREAESEVSMCDVWDGFDEGNAAYVPDVYTPFKMGDSLSPHVSLNKVQPQSPLGPEFRPTINSKYFVTPTSMSKVSKCESSLSSHISSSSKKTSTTHRFNFNSPESSFSVITTEDATPKSSVLPRNCRAAVASTTEVRYSVDSFSPPTDMDTDVSGLLDQFVANADDSFEDLTSSVSLGKSSMIEPPGFHKTPVVKQKKNVLKKDFTPLPDYHQMVTPTLKMHCKKFGVRALPKKTMIKVLENIYYGTHPMVEAPKEPEKKVIGKKCATSKCTKTTKEKLPEKISNCKQIKKQIVASDTDQISASEMEQNQLNKQQGTFFNNAGSTSSVSNVRPLKNKSCASSKTDSSSESCVSPSKKKTSCASSKTDSSSGGSDSPSKKKKASCASSKTDSSSEGCVSPSKKKKASCASNKTDFSSGGSDSPSKKKKASCASSKTDSSSGGSDSPSKKKKASCASNKTDSSSGGSDSPSKKKKASCASNKTDSSGVSPSEKKMTSCTSKSQAATITNSESDNSDSSDESDRESIPEESVMYSPESPQKKRRKVEPKVKLDEAGKKKQLHDHITSNRELYTRILLYEPLDIVEIAKQLKSDGIRQTIKEIMNFFDDQNILYSTRNSNFGWKARVEKKKNAKNSSQTSGNNTE